MILIILSITRTCLILQEFQQKPQCHFKYEEQIYCIQKMKNSMFVHFILIKILPYSKSSKKILYIVHIFKRRYNSQFNSFQHWNLHQQFTNSPGKPPKKNWHRYKKNNPNQPATFARKISRTYTRKTESVQHSKAFSIAFFMLPCGLVTKPTYTTHPVKIHPEGGPLRWHTVAVCSLCHLFRSFSFFGFHI